MIITKKQEEITYKAETAEIELDINGKTVRVCDWYKQDSTYSNYENDTELNEDDMKLLSEDEAEAINEFLSDYREMKIGETIDTEVPVEEKNPQCRIYGGDVLPDEENNCSLCGGLMNEYGECQGKRSLAIKHQ